MNLVVSNKYKNLIYSSNIEILKELNGVFSVKQIVNSFNNIFYKKIIIDATALENFPKDNVLKELVESFDSDKLILLLPPDNPPPRNFLSFLVSINLFNFTDNTNGLLHLINKSNTLEDVSNFIVVKETKEQPKEENNLFDNDVNERIIIGFRGITEKSFVTEIIYMIKRSLEEVHKKRVIAVEIDKNEFNYYNSENMYSVSKDRIVEFLNNNYNCDVLLIDLNDENRELCDNTINLINPSLYNVNKLLYLKRDAFIKLKGEKVVFVNSLLQTNDINQFAKEANLSVYYNLPPLNDRIYNKELDKLLEKLGIIEIKPAKEKKGLFDLFK